MAGKFTAAQVRAWKDGAEGFLQWVRDIKPRVLTAENRYEVFVPADFQADAIRKTLARNDDGTWKYITICLSFPRRHSKTTLMALLAIWRFSLWPNENIVAMATSEKQVLATGFKLVRGIILNTPALLKQIGRENVQMYRIDYPALQSSIRTVSTNVSALYGEKITVGWCSEIHAAGSDDAMQVLASSLGDSKNSWMLLDSTVDAVGGPIHRLEQMQESGENETVFVYRLEYTDIDEALEKSPPWINRKWLKDRKAQLPPAVFASQHLNQRSAAMNNLFAISDIQACMERLPCPFSVDDLKRVAGGRTYICGGGLDRAYFASLHGDATIWTCVAKVAGEGGAEPHFYVLNQKNILGSLASGIKKAMVADHEAFRLTNTNIEAYNAQDIATWAAERQVPAEIIHATNTAQVPAFMELYRIVKEHRLHFSDKLTALSREMETFVYELKGGQPKFGSDKWHDDTVYSLAWAVHSLRDRELAAFTLNNVICSSASPHARLCYLRGSDMVLSCSEFCPSHKRVQMMFNQYMARNINSELTLSSFFNSLVKVEGIRMHQEI